MNLENFIRVVSTSILTISDPYERGSNRPLGRKDWHILYIIKGRCFVSIDDIEFECKSGTVVIYPPDTPQKYRFNKNEESKYFFVHFEGDWCYKLLGELTERIYFIGKNINLEEMIYKFVDEYTLKLPFYETLSGTMLLSIITFILREISYANLEYNSRKKVMEICRYMQSNYSEKLAVGDYANMCNLSESRFSHLFKEIMNISPQQYLVDIRIQKAKSLLEDTDLPISKISDIVGLQNQHYFSRMFKKYTLLSPLEYRKSMR